MSSNASFRASASPVRVAVTGPASPAFTFMRRAGKSMLHRTATAFGRVIAGKCRNQSLVVAARPAADRSPVRRHHAHTYSRTPSQFRSRFSSGTLPLVNQTQILKVSRRPGYANASATSARAATPPAPPNPSIERTRSGSAGLALISFWAKPAPPPRAAHVKR